MTALEAKTIAADVVLTGNPTRPVLTATECRFTSKIQSLEPLSEVALNTSNSDSITLLTPGLVNAHAHLELYTRTPVTCLPNETMGHWLLRVVNETRQLDASMREANALKSAQILLQSGCTTINDISSDGASLAVLDRLGMRGIVSLEFFHAAKTLNEDKLAPLEARYKMLQEQVENHPCLSVGLSPHSPYNVSRAAFSDMLARCQPSMIHTHVGESDDEVRWFHGESSAINDLHRLLLGESFSPDVETPAQFMAALLAAYQDSKTCWTLAHAGTLLNDELFGFSKDPRVGFAHCPLSNAFLNNPKLDVDLLASDAIRVGLGTDSLFSNMQLDLRAEARDAVARGLSPEAAFKLLTTGGASVMGLSAHIGQLSTDFAADMVLWEAPRIEGLSPYELLLHPATTTKRAWVNGQTLFEK